jgi:hypothetical protein
MNGPYSLLEITAFKLLSMKLFVSKTFLALLIYKINENQSCKRQRFPFAIPGSTSLVTATKTPRIA